jgi:hypothetical protein
MSAGRVYAWGSINVLSAFFDLAAPPASLKVLLLNALPEEDADLGTLGDLEPPTLDGYARISVDTGSSEWALSSDAVVTNLNTLAFPQSTGVWGNITHWGLAAPTGTGLLACNALSEPTFVTTGVTVRLTPGVVAFSLTSSDDPVIA